MTKDPLAILEMVYCGAIRRGNLEDLRDLEELREIVKKNL